MSKDIFLDIEGIKCRCNEVNITCYDSHQLSNNKIREFVSILRRDTYSNGLSYYRTNLSWEKEIYAHNILYRKGLYVVSTKDTDLTEGEEFHRILFYNILYYFHKYIWSNIKNICIKIGACISKLFKK